MVLSPFQRLFQPPAGDKDKQSESPSRKQSSRNISPQDLGLLEVAGGDDSVVDIVAVHGLNGHRDRTWAAANGNWLRSLLPSDIPNARIFCWGYDANTHSTSSQLSHQYLHNHATNLVSDLCLRRKRTKTTTRPIIFVAHGLGGIIVKSALIHSYAARQGAQEDHRSIWLSTYGIMFMGTPHQGSSGVQLGKLIANVASVFVAADNRLLKHLEQDSEWLQQQLGQYAPISGDFKTKFFYEEYPTETKLGSIMVVPRASAVVPGVADAEAIVIHADHVNMVKFSSREENGYKTVSEHLWIMTQEADEIISRRWETERRVNAARANVVPKYFEVPRTAIAKSFGRQQLLELLDECFQPQQNQDRPVVVVLQAMGGQGKSQLALEYCRKQREAFRGVFWVDATSKATAEEGFESILLKVSPQTVQHLNDIQSKIKCLLDRIEEWRDRWLIVFDNYDDPQSVPEIKEFIRMSGPGSIIITSRHAGAASLGKLINVPSMINDGGTELLLQSFHTNKRENYNPEGEKIRMLLSEFISEYEKQKARILKYTREELWEYRKSINDPETLEELSAFTTWEMSFQQIEPRNADRKQHIARFPAVSAYLDPSQISDFIFAIYLQNEREPLPWTTLFSPSRDTSDIEESAYP